MRTDQRLAGTYVLLDAVVLVGAPTMLAVGGMTIAFEVLALAAIVLTLLYLRDDLAALRAVFVVPRRRVVVRYRSRGGPT